MPSTAATQTTEPAPAEPPRIRKQPLPDIPALVLAGSDDLRAPAGQGQRAVGAFPDGRFLAVQGAGHSVALSWMNTCAQIQVRRWTLGRVPRTACQQTKTLGFASRFPSSFGALSPSGSPGQLGTHARSGAGRHQGRRHVRGLLPERGAPGFGGAVGGSATLQGNLEAQLTLPVTLTRYSWVSGAQVSGTLLLHVTNFGSAIEVSGGHLTVSGQEAAHGTLTVGPGSAVSGVLGGRSVSAPR